MKSSKNDLLLIFSFLLPFYLFAQIGPHASNIKWQQINTPKVRVIFPEGFEKQGLRVANMVNYMEQNHKRSIGELSQKLELVLHNQTIIPNGFVGTSPFRSEFFGTPPQSANLLGTVDWLDALTIHEYRHALQFSNAKVGITKLAYYLQGDNGWGLTAGASIPGWFWEGDATVMETALSKGGRGRAPFFTLEQRATLLNGRNYNYQKARNGSFKDMVPNHYRLGYAMITHAQQQFGNDVWREIFENAARYKYIIYPFSRALKKRTGLTTKYLYQETYQTSKERWAKQVSNLNLSPSVPIKTKRLKTITNYRFPYYQKDSSVICLKSSYQKTDALIRITNGKEKVLTKIGFHVEKYLSITGNKAVWTEYERDPRRSKRNFSNIVFYDFKTKKKTRFSTEKRYFSPDFSYSEGRIVVVQITPEQKNTLLILNAKTGEKTSILPNPENHFLAFPKWSENDTDIVFIAKKNSQLAIFKYNLIDHSTKQLTNWTSHTIANLFVKNNEVFFTASFSGIDNIYKTKLDGKKRIEQLTSVKIGAFFSSVSFDDKSLIFSEFTDMGYQLSSLDLATNTARNSTIQIVEPNQQNHYLINSISEEGGNILDKIPTENHKIQDYKGLFKGLKLHSWNLTPSVALPTLDIQIDNILDNLSMNLIGGINLNENSPVFVASATYGKWYPLLTGFTSIISRKTNFLTPQDTLARQEFDQNSIGGRMTIPLVFIKDNFSTSFQVFGGYAHRFIRNAVIANESVENHSLGTVQLGLSVAHLRRTALQNLGPRLGQTFNINYQQTTDSQTDKIVKFGASLFFPGIGPNDNLRLGIAYQRQLLKNNYRFSDSFEYPRGFGGLLNDEFVKLSADYQFPVIYPDWGFWGITYFKRISMNLFFDYGVSKIEVIDRTKNHNSIGAEIIFDNNFFHELPITFGVRNAYRLTEEENKYQVEFFVKSFILE